MSLVFDIETVPTATALAMPYPEADRNPPGNYKNEDAIAKWRAGDRERWEAERVKECSLTPRLGRVVAIAFSVPGHENVAIAATEADEATLLEDFWQSVRGERQIAGWNSHGFDFPFLLVRSLLLGVDHGMADVTPYLRRYSYQPHFDAKMALTAWDARTGGTLDDWCAAFGIAGKSGHGSEVYGMVTRGEWDALRTYARGDLEATKDIVARVGPAFGVREVSRGA